jgi:phage host-nuclease inhibitor protein Gam
MPRIKTSAQLPQIKTRAEMEALVGDIANLKLFEIETKAIMDGRLKEIREDYEAQLAEAGKQIEGMMALAQQWADANPDAFAGKKSIEMVHGTVGFRTGTPKLVKKTREKWDALVAAIRAALGGAYVRTIEEVDKESIIRDYRAGQISDATLREAKLEVTQDEAFYVEPKLTKVEQRESV